jgi:hypothetical protein
MATGRFSRRRINGMDYYKLADGTLVGTQADARASKQKWEWHAVPTDKLGLMDYLNARKIAAGEPSTRDFAQAARELPSPAPLTALEVVSVARDRSLERLARIDAPDGVDVDGIGETILKSSGYVLASFAEAVAMRYGMLAKGRG